MSRFTREQRLKIGLGGFLLLVGFAVLILNLLVVTRTIDTESILQDSLIVLVAAIGGLDVIAGIMLLRSE